MTTNIDDVILEAIQYGINQTIAPLLNQDVTGIFKGIDSSTNKYIVQINGIEYRIYNGVGINLNTNDVVWVKIPQGNMRKAYICAKANGNA